MKSQKKMKAQRKSNHKKILKQRIFRTQSMSVSENVIVR